MWLFSPIIYKGFNIISLKIKENYVDLKKKRQLDFFQKFRKINNLLLSFYSAILTCYSLIEISNQISNYKIKEIVCKEFELNNNMNWIMTSFYYSKYWEWLDTFFLIIFEKYVSKLHYYHHLSTPFLSYITVFYQGITPSYIYACVFNGFVHTLMYYYFAFPKGTLSKYKKVITRLQIIQHFYMLFSILGIYNLCSDKFFKFILPMTSGFICYSYYLVKFLLFYFKKYRS